MCDRISESVDNSTVHVNQIKHFVKILLEADASELLYNREEISSHYLLINGSWTNAYRYCVTKNTRL